MTLPPRTLDSPTSSRLEASKVGPVAKECFLVTTSNRLVNGEQDRAEAWPAKLPDLVGAPA